MINFTNSDYVKAIKGKISNIGKIYYVDFNLSKLVKTIQVPYLIQNASVQYEHLTICGNILCIISYTSNHIQTCDKEFAVSLHSVEQKCLFLLNEELFFSH